MAWVPWIFCDKRLTEADLKDVRGTYKAKPLGRGDELSIVVSLRANVVYGQTRSELLPEGHPFNCWIHSRQVLQIVTMQATLRTRNDCRDFLSSLSSPHTMLLIRTTPKRLRTCANACHTRLAYFKSLMEPLEGSECDSLVLCGYWCQDCHPWPQFSIAHLQIGLDTVIICPEIIQKMLQQLPYDTSVIPWATGLAMAKVLVSIAFLRYFSTNIGVPPHSVN